MRRYKRPIAPKDRASAWPELRWFYPLLGSRAHTTRYPGPGTFMATRRVCESGPEVEAVLALDTWVRGPLTFDRVAPFPHVEVEYPVRETRTRVNCYPAWVAAVLALGSLPCAALRRAVMRSTAAYREDLGRVYSVSGDPLAVLAFLRATLPPEAWADGVPFLGLAPLANTSGTGQVV